MSGGENKAGQKFWGTPELVEKILPFLDLTSTLSLVQSKVMSRKILQGGIVWNRLIRRSSPLDELAVVAKLVQILKLMKEPTTLMLDLLDLICESRVGDRMINLFGTVQMSCPRHPNSHLVRLSDFRLLEEVEGAFGTAEQTVEAVNADHQFGPFPEFALSSRLSRQQEKMATFSGIVYSISSKESAEAFKNIVAACHEFSILTLQVKNPILNSYLFTFLHSHICR